MLLELYFFNTDVVSPTEERKEFKIVSSCK